MDKEIWKDIEGYEGLYQVSTLGRVKSLDRFVERTNNYKASLKGRILKLSYRRGYLCVSLGKKNSVLVHRLVAKTFIPNPDNKPQVNHIDGDKQNNCVNNLEWSTAKENTVHAFKTGLAHGPKGYFDGEKGPAAKLTNNDAIKIRNEYIPFSRTFGTRALAKKYGVTHTVISCIVRNKTFKNIQ